MSQVGDIEVEELLLDVLTSFSLVAMKTRFITSMVTAYQGALDLDVESLSREDRRKWQRRTEEAFDDENMAVFATERELVQEQFAELSERVDHVRELLEHLEEAAIDVDPVLLAMRKF